MSATKTIDITPQSIMGDILEAFPSAKRALDQRVHGLKSFLFYFILKAG